MPKLLEAGHGVTVLDLFIYGEAVFDDLPDRTGLTLVRGDLRDAGAVALALDGCDAVIHLACISNDPSFELDPDLGRSINFDAFRPLVRAAKVVGVRRFIYASSSSVYGIKDDAEVTEELALEPLTDYSKYKAMCEEVLEQEREPGFVTLTLRPATVCGYSPRLRLDLTVNILTNHAINNGRITVFGGAQKRPNINIEDMTDLYVRCLEYPDDMIDGRVFNAGYENHRVSQLAEIVRDAVGQPVEIVTTPSDDHRSYHVSSARIGRGPRILAAPHDRGCRGRPRPGLRHRPGGGRHDRRSILQRQTHAGLGPRLTGRAQRRTASSRVAGIFVTTSPT